MNYPTLIQYLLAKFFPPKSDYGSKAIWIPLLKKYIHFCKQCGEYITKDTGCSNSICPEKIYDGLDNH